MFTEAIALYLLGLVLRNQQLVTVAVVLLSFLTWAAFRTTLMFHHQVEDWMTIIPREE